MLTVHVPVRHSQALSITRTHSAMLAPLFMASFTALYSVSYFLSRLHASYTAILCSQRITRQDCAKPDAHMGAAFAGTLRFLCKTFLFRQGCVGSRQATTPQ